MEIICTNYNQVCALALSLYGGDRNIEHHRMCCKYRFQNIEVLISFSFDFVNNYMQRQATELVFTKVIAIALTVACNMQLSPSIYSQMQKKENLTKLHLINILTTFIVWNTTTIPWINNFMQIYTTFTAHGCISMFVLIWVQSLFPCYQITIAMFIY